VVCMALPMFAETDTTSGNVPLAKRAEVAMLSLQLRAAEREAEAAEALLEERTSGRSDDNVVDMLDPLLVRRQTELESDFAVARRVAAVEIARAHQQVAEWLAAAPAAPDASDGSVASAESDESSKLPVALFTAEPRIATVRNDAGFDAEGFARAFAQSFGKVLDERAPMLYGATAPRPRFWAHAKHIDVLLIVAATAIVGVVLAAWMV